MRKGFTLTFQMLLDRSSDVNYTGLIDVIEKESVFSKSEKIHYKNCMLTGKILLYRSILSVKSIGIDDILRIFKILTDLLTENHKIVEDSLLNTIDQFFTNVYFNFYTEMQETSNQKHLSKFIDKFLNLLIKVRRSNYENITNLYEYSILLIFDKFAFKKNSLKKTSFLYQFSSCFENFVGKTLENSFYNKNNLENFFILLIKSKKENDFSISFKMLLDNLKEKKHFENGYNIWNYLIDSETNEKFKEISVKNYQLLLFKYSIFLIKDLFKLKYISQIFYDNQVSNYCLNLLNIFGSDRNINLSPNTFKSIYIVINYLN